jgi:hypothetical protein
VDFGLIFIWIQQLDDSAYPDKSMVTKVMTKRIRDPKVKDFIEESIDDCFELLETGESVNTQNVLNVHVYYF